MPGRKEKGHGIRMMDAKDQYEVGCHLKSYAGRNQVETIANVSLHQAGKQPQGGLRLRLALLSLPLLGAGLRLLVRLLPRGAGDGLRLE